MKRAVLYARVSTDAQQKEGTIDSQVLELKRQIATAGDVLVKQYVDDGYSGTLLDRPALEELRRDVKTNLFDAVYFLDTDRIARDVAYQTIILGELLKYGKQIIIKGKDYVNNPENKFTVTVLGAVAELERAKIIERTTRGRLHRLRMGELSSNGHRIYGYHYIKKTPASPAALVINQEQAPVHGPVIDGKPPRRAHDLVVAPRRGAPAVADAALDQALQEVVGDGPAHPQLHSGLGRLATRSGNLAGTGLGDSDQSRRRRGRQPREGGRRGDCPDQADPERVADVRGLGIQAAI
jgi:DNA invertase Pin-like site-specific DNA recombinase